MTKPTTVGQYLLRTGRVVYKKDRREDIPWIPDPADTYSLSFHELKREASESADFPRTNAQCCIEFVGSVDEDALGEITLTIRYDWAVLETANAAEAAGAAAAFNGRTFFKPGSGGTR